MFHLAVHLEAASVRLPVQLGVTRAGILTQCSGMDRAGELIRCSVYFAENGGGTIFPRFTWGLSTEPLISSGFQTVGRCSVSVEEKTPCKAGKNDVCSTVRPG